MAAAAGRSLLLLLSSRGGGGAGGCGALTAGCFPALGVSRHRQQQHHRTVSERARRLRGGRGGAAVWDQQAGRPPGQRASYLNSRPLQRLPGTEEPPCPSGACGGNQEKRQGGGSREEEGRRQGCSRRTGDTRAGKGRDLNLSLTRPRSRSLPPFYLTALPYCSRTEPRSSCPLSLLLQAGWGVLSCRGCLVYVSGEWQCHTAGNCPPEGNPGPQRGRSLVLFSTLWERARQKIKLYPPV